MTDGPNVYVHARNNPIGRVDPSGLYGPRRDPGGGGHWESCINWGKVLAGIAVIATCAGIEAAFLYSAFVTGGLTLPLEVAFHSGLTLAAIMLITLVGIPMMGDGLDDPC